MCKKIQNIFNKKDKNTSYSTEMNLLINIINYNESIYW